MQFQPAWHLPTHRTRTPLTLSFTSPLSLPPFPPHLSPFSRSRALCFSASRSFVRSRSLPRSRSRSRPPPRSLLRLRLRLPPRLRSLLSLSLSRSLSRPLSRSRTPPLRSLSRPEEPRSRPEDAPPRSLLRLRAPWLLSLHNGPTTRARARVSSSRRAGQTGLSLGEIGYRPHGLAACGRAVSAPCCHMHTQTHGQADANTQDTHAHTHVHFCTHAVTHLLLSCFFSRCERAATAAPPVLQLCALRAAAAHTMSTAKERTPRLFGGPCWHSSMAPPGLYRPCPSSTSPTKLTIQALKGPVYRHVHCASHILCLAEACIPSQSTLQHNLPPEPTPRPRVSVPPPPNLVDWVLSLSVPCLVSWPLQSLSPPPAMLQPPLPPILPTLSPSPSAPQCLTPHLSCRSLSLSLSASAPSRLPDALGPAAPASAPLLLVAPPEPTSSCAHKPGSADYWLGIGQGQRGRQQAWESRPCDSLSHPCRAGCMAPVEQVVAPSKAGCGTKLQIRWWHQAKQDGAPSSASGGNRQCRQPHRRWHPCIEGRAACLESHLLRPGCTRRGGRCSILLTAARPWPLVGCPGGKACSRRPRRSCCLTPRLAGRGLRLWAGIGDGLRGTARGSGTVAVGPAAGAGGARNCMERARIAQEHKDVLYGGMQLCRDVYVHVLRVHVPACDMQQHTTWRTRCAGIGTPQGAAGHPNTEGTEAQPQKASSPALGACFVLASHATRAQARAAHVDALTWRCTPSPCGKAAGPPARRLHRPPWASGTAHAACAPQPRVARS